MAQKTLEKRKLKARVKKRVATLMKQSGRTTSEIASIVATEFQVTRGYVKNLGKFKRD